MLIEASARVRAPRELVHDVLTDVDGWPLVFPTIHGILSAERAGNRSEVVVDHREGPVLNVLTEAAPDTVILDERKAHYDAMFVNRFDALPDGTTRYVVVGRLGLRGWRRALGPFAGWYGSRQLLRLTVRPLKSAAEARTIDRTGERTGGVHGCQGKDRREPAPARRLLRRVD